MEKAPGAPPEEGTTANAGSSRCPYSSAALPSKCQLAERRPGAAAQPGGQEDDVGSLGVRCHRLPNALGVLADAFATVVQAGARAIVPVQTDVDALLTAERRLVSARSECR